MKKYLAILLVLFMPPVFAQEVISTYSGNIFNPSPNPTDVATGVQGYGMINQPLSCMAPGQPGYCGPYAAVNAWGENSNVINFSYGTSDIFQDFNLRNILPKNGEYIFTGYDFTFIAKNGNGWDDGRLDYLYSYVDLFKGNNLISHNVLDLNYKFGWTPFYFGTTFETPYKLSEVDGIRIGFVGRDNNFWAGFYGPEVTQIGFGVYYQEDPCAKDPLSSPTCAGYIDALLKLTSVTVTTTDTTATDTGVTTTVSTKNEDTFATTQPVSTIQETSTSTLSLVPLDEKMLAVTTTASTLTTPTSNTTGSSAAYRELTDEEKAAILADAISKSAMESALAIAADSTSKSLAGNDGQNFGTTTITATKNSNGLDIQNNTITDSTDTSTGIDVLETGRQSGVAALNTTLAQTETISLESIQQAENISNLSSQESQSFATESQVENEVKDITIDSVIETVNNVLQLVNSNTNNQNSSNPNYTGLNEDEQITVSNDPTLAAAFNTTPNFANLEIIGVIKPVEEKSDAEKRAEEIVAANAKEQEEINNNYMNADQSGLVAAIGADADVSSYRKAMLPDNNLWYKPEDIYKNVSYKDNVRGMYFLEKGNTDTYNKMVEEQYK